MAVSFKFATRSRAFFLFSLTPDGKEGGGKGESMAGGEWLNQDQAAGEGGGTAEGSAVAHRRGRAVPDAVGRKEKGEEREHSRGSREPDSCSGGSCRARIAGAGERPEEGTRPW
jgi:hypothetical protein